MYDATAHPDWSQAYASYAAELYDFVRTRVPAPEVDDLLQDVWTSLSTTLETQPIEQPRAWLYRVTRNRITDLYRRAAARPPIQDVTDYDLADAASSLEPYSDTLAEDISAALDLLPPNQREVFVRNELNGETLREIAADLGIPLKTAISRKGYARARLRDLLRETYADYFGVE
ncbi:RNA polymerase sigma factor [Neolewinella sp.]|uniref:RNA polymerase sigma factor n=1 Tax=Neolewinella sp. TaxID=2993543 RepID=UPI003B527A0B